MDQLLRGIALLALLAVATRAKSIANYDQRQEGKVNVQIDVKDVSIVALVDSDMLEDFASYDYAYDYADFTIKPSSRPTTSAKPPAIEDSSPTSTSTEKTSDAASSTAANSTSEELSAAITQSTASTTTTSADDTAGTTNSKIIEIIINPTKAAGEASSTTTTAAPSSTRRPAGIAEPRKKCPVGFLLKSGRCFKRRLSLISPRVAMMKLAPALLSRAKVLARNLTTEDS